MNDGNENMQPQQHITLRDLREKLNTLMSDITERTARVNTALRLLQSRLHEGSNPVNLLEDAVIIIELCVDTLPHHYDEINDPWGAISLKLVEIESANAPDEKAQHITKVIKAMAVTADPDSTIAELTEAGMELYRLATRCIEFDPNWKAWMEIMGARGFSWDWPEFLDADGVWQLRLVPPECSRPQVVPIADSIRNAVSGRLSAEEIETVMHCAFRRPECVFKGDTARQQ